MVRRRQLPPSDRGVAAIGTIRRLIRHAGFRMMPSASPLTFLRKGANRG
jgi:hypothetical protein